MFDMRLNYACVAHKQRKKDILGSVVLIIDIFHHFRRLFFIFSEREIYGLLYFLQKAFCVSEVQTHAYTEKQSKNIIW